MDTVRLDRLLVDRGLVTSRPRAERIITLHGVRVDGVEMRKPGKKVSLEATIELLGEDLPWVSRGALKLVAALDHYQLDPTGRTVLDLGASTGGFTEVCLKRGARFVHAVDVGTNQLVDALRQDPRVADLQQTHLKDLHAEQLQPVPNSVVIDLSFIFSGPRLASVARVARPCGLGHRTRQTAIRSRTEAPRAQRCRPGCRHSKEGRGKQHGPGR